MTAPKREHSVEEQDISKASERVGRFFFHWAFLEAVINGIIQRLFNIEESEADIVTANIQFRDKLNIVHTALMWQGTTQSDDWRRSARKTIARIGRLTSQRNLIAHCLFMPTKDGFVRFFKVEARGEYDTPLIYWGPKDFQCKYDLIDAAADKLEDLSKQLQNRKQLISALTANPKTMGGVLGLGFASSQTPLVLSLHGSSQSPANQETNPQKPKEPQGSGLRCPVSHF